MGSNNRNVRSDLITLPPFSNVKTLDLSSLPVRPPPLSQQVPPSKSHLTARTERAKWSVHPLLPQNHSFPDNPPFQKCDGALPHCNRCVRTKRAPSCTYDLPFNQKRKVLALQKGEACIPCRSVGSLFTVEILRGRSQPVYSPVFHFHPSTHRTKKKVGVLLLSLPEATHLLTPVFPPIALRRNKTRLSAMRCRTLSRSMRV